MSYTPRSTGSRDRTRFSTPEPELDDHRHQEESLPLANEHQPGQRRGTLASLADEERPNMQQLGVPGPVNFASVSRDFEQAIVDDDKSMKSNKSTGSNRSQMSKKSHRSADEEWHRDRRGSNSPVVARRSTFRQAIRNRGRDIRRGQGSRESSASRSTSPPNSVDAFAPPKRGRAGTMQSHNPGSVENLTLQRTISNKSNTSTHPGTFRGTAGHRTDVASIRSSVEEDVCFPPEEQTNTYTIDFEDLEEFVAQEHDKTPVAHPFMPNYGQLPQEKRVFPDLRQNAAAGNVPFDGVEKYGKDTDYASAMDRNEKEAGLESSSEEVTKVVTKVDSNGPRPNRFTFFSSEIDETVHAPELGGLLMPNETFRDLFELGPDGGVWWLDMLNPSEEEVFAICGAFRVHPLTREDITTQETREKVELFKSYYFVCFRSFYAVDKNSENYLEPINVYAVVFREGLLTFSFCTNPHAANVRKRISRLRDYVNLSADWVCYALIDEIVDAFAPVLRDVEHETESVEDEVFTARFEDSRAVLMKMGDIRKRVMSLMRLLGGKADVIKGFAKKCNEQYSVAPRGDVGLYLSDVQDHVVTMMSNLTHFEKMLSRSHSNHLSQISLNHIEQGSQANHLLSKVTVLATILVPLNLIAGLFGMNVEVPGQNATGLGWWFGIVGIIALVTISALTLAKKLKWV